MNNLLLTKNELFTDFWNWSLKLKDDDPAPTQLERFNKVAKLQRDKIKQRLQKIALRHKKEIEIGNFHDFGRDVSDFINEI